MKHVRLSLVGFGVVGQGFAELIMKKHAYLEHKFYFSKKDIGYVKAYQKLRDIAEYLNDGWVCTNHKDAGWHLFFDGGDRYKCAYDTVKRTGCIYFKSKELAQQAIELMGDELEHLK